MGFCYDTFVVFGWEVPYEHVVAFLARNKADSCGADEVQCVCGVDQCWKNIASCFPEGVAIVHNCPGPDLNDDDCTYFVTLLKERYSPILSAEAFKQVTEKQIEDGRAFVKLLRREYRLENPVKEKKQKTEEEEEEELTEAPILRAELFVN